MRRVLHNIPVIALAVVMLLALSCRKDGAQVIPRDQLAKIYAEMLVTDQWIMSTPGVRLIADTSLVYEPILEKYGYTSEDYLKTVDVYMNDPERFARILRTSTEILDKRLVALKKQKSILSAHERKEKEREEMEKMLQADFDPAEYFPYLFDEPYIHYFDSLSFEPDSTLWVYRLIPIERADTIYDRITMIVRSDTLAVIDSVPHVDSLADKPESAQAGAMKLKNIGMSSRLNRKIRSIEEDGKK